MQFFILIFNIYSTLSFLRDGFLLIIYSTEFNIHVCIICNILANIIYVLLKVTEQLTLEVGWTPQCSRSKHIFLNVFPPRCLGGDELVP